MIFHTQLDLRAYWGHPKEWVLASDFIFEHDGQAFRVPRGFITDLASTPIGNVNDQSRWAAVGHDWNYCAGVLDRDRVDEIFREGLLVSGYSRARALAYYSAVRACGWRYWGRRRRNPLNASYDFVQPGYWLDIQPYPRPV